VTYFCIWNGLFWNLGKGCSYSVQTVCRTFDAAFVKLLWHFVIILSAMLLARRIEAEMLDLLIVEWSVKCLQWIISLTRAATNVLLRGVCLAGFRGYVLVLKGTVAKKIRLTLPLSYPFALQDNQFIYF